MRTLSAFSPILFDDHAPLLIYRLSPRGRLRPLTRLRIKDFDIWHFIPRLGRGRYLVSAKSPRGWVRRVLRITGNRKVSYRTRWHAKWDRLEDE